MIGIYLFIYKRGYYQCSRLLRPHLGGVGVNLLLVSEVVGMYVHTFLLIIRSYDFICQQRQFSSESYCLPHTHGLLQNVATRLAIIRRYALAYTVYNTSQNVMPQHDTLFDE